MDNPNVIERLLMAIKQIDKNYKKDFERDLKKCKNEFDKFDPIIRNFFETIELLITLNIDDRLIKIILDIADNIDNPNIPLKFKTLLDELIIKYLNLSKAIQSQGSIKGEELWEETKKIRKALKK